MTNAELADELARQAAAMNQNSTMDYVVFGEFALNNLPAILSALRRVEGLEKAERLLALRTRQLMQANELWCGAAENALLNDSLALRLRVDMHRASPVEVVLSDAVLNEGSGE